MTFCWKKLVFTVAVLAVTFAAAADRPRQKVIVLGFDGVDATYTEKWMNEGKLPNMAKLRAEGTYRPLRPTIPAQTPVSWSTFTTGIDPGRTAIFDFLRRDPKTYLPVFAAFDETVEPLGFGKKNAAIAAAAALLLVFAIVFLLVWLISRKRRIAVITGAILGIAASAGAFVFTTKYIPSTRPGVVNRRQGIPMWEAAARSGLKTRVFRVPVTFPANDYPNGHLFSGLGVPDMSARVGKPFYFTSELDFKKGDSSSNEFSIEVVQLEDNKGVIQTSVVGPPNKLFKKPPYIAAPLTITVANDRNSVMLQSGDSKATLKAGQWSDWFTFTFAFNPVVKVTGTSRFFLIESQPEVKLYLSPINFDPRNLPPGMKVTTPTAWAGDLAHNFGLFKTMGWAIDTWAISEGFANEQMFWDDMQWTEHKYRKMFTKFLDDDDDLLVQYFEFPDRVGHVFWRFIDPTHPAYDAKLASKWGDGLLRAYQEMDDIVGEAMRAADRHHAALIVLSDHGFAPWRKSVNYNTWLVQNGYLAVKTGVEVKERNLELLFDQGQFWENVDWSKTRAYALGLGDVYINMKGREVHGIVNPGAETEALKKELKQKFEAMVDPENGQHPVSKVYFREEAYRSFDPNLIPDMFVTNSAGYRVSWQTSLGGIQKNLFEENKRVWSGDHCSVDPELVKGVFFYNRKLATARAPYIADIYPTVLDLLHVPPPYQLDGVALK